MGLKKLLELTTETTLCNIRFNLNACKNLSKNELDALSKTAINFFHFIQAFDNKLRLRHFVNIWMVEDRMQNLDCATCGIFQLYFYNNLFNPDENSKIQDKARLNRRTIENLLNELFILDNQDKNDETIRQYTDKNNSVVA